MIIIIILILFFGAISIIYLTRLNDNNYYMSFRESMDLVEMPIVTFYQGDKKINFLLDTGSNYSLLNAQSIIDLGLKYSESNTKSEIVGINGKNSESYGININFQYKDFKFSYTFQVLDISKAFNELKKEYGVTVHGILGNQFFKEYGYILDFDKLVAYSKK